jgi:hypothetical protein
MLCAGYSSVGVDANCVLSAFCGLLLEYCWVCGLVLEYCRLCVSQACFVPATPLVGWMLTVCCQPAVLYYWNTAMSVCVSGMLCAGYSSGGVDANCVLSACCVILLEYCHVCVCLWHALCRLLLWSCEF